MKTFLLFLLILLPVLPGCIDSTSKNDAPKIQLYVGDAATYVGSDGSRLHVEIIGDSVARDPYLTERPAIAIRYTLIPVRYPETEYHIIEFMDRSSGLIVNHQENCVVMGVSENNPAELHCAEGREIIRWAPAGLPALLGGGPFWTDARLSHQMRLNHPTSGWTTLPFRAESKTEDCVTLTFDRMERDVRIGDWMPVTTLDHPLLFCPDAPLPREFIPTTGMWGLFSGEKYPTFRLTEWSRGNAPLAPHSDADDGVAGPDLGRKGWNAPHFVYTDDGYTNFSTEEAHRFAMEHDAVYRRIMSGPGAFLRTNHYMPGGTRTDNLPLLGSTEERDYGRTFIASNGAEKDRLVSMEKTVINRDGTVSSRVRLVETTDVDRDVRPGPEILAGPTIDPIKVLGFTTNLTDSPPMSTRLDFELNQWTVGEPRVPRGDGVRFVVRHPPDSIETGPLLIPEEFVFDGHSGSFLQIQADRVTLATIK